MAQSPDHPGLAFVQARYYGNGRPLGPPKWIIAHTMEAGESSTRAESTAAYFADPGDGRVVSAHYCADNNSIVQCVRLSDHAYTVGNWQGNQRGINWEFSGFAAQSGAQWGDDFSMDMLRISAPYWYADAERYGIPIVRRTVAELRDGRPGLTTHRDMGVAFGGTTHTDPGPNFPWAEFIEMIKGGGDVMEQDEFNDLMDGYINARTGGSQGTNTLQRTMRARARQWITGTAEVDDPETVDEQEDASVDRRLNELDTKVDDAIDKLDQILTALAAGGGGGGGVTVNLSGQVTGTLTSD